MQEPSPPQDPTALLQRLYLSYTCKGTRSKLDMLTSSKFIHLIKDAGVIEPGFSLKDADILVSKVLKRTHTMDFETFCELIGRVAKAKFEEVYTRVSPAAALRAFIQKYVVPLCQAETQEIDRLEQQEITEQCLELLSETKDVLTEMYERNFPWELRSAEPLEVLAKRSESTLMNLVIGLNIVPEVMSKTSATLVLHSTLATTVSITNALKVQDEGIALTLNRFLVFVARCGLGSSLMADAEPHVSLALLFEVVEMSPGFQQFEGISHRTHTARMTLMTPKVLTVLEPMLNPEKPPPRELDLSTMPIPSEQLDQHLESLEHIFQSYCSYGEPLNTTHLKEYKFLRMLTDAGLLNKMEESTGRMHTQPEGVEGVLTKNQATFIFVKVTESHFVRSDIKIPTFKPTSYLASKDAEHGRMTFHQFIQALGRVAEIVNSHLPPDEALLGLLESHILRLEAVLIGHGLSSDRIKQLLTEIKEESMQRVMLALLRCLDPFYRTYSDSKGFMNREKFIRFCVDFELFPDIISKAKLVQFFVALASIYKKQSLGLTATLSLTRSNTGGLPIDQTDTDVIDVGLFIEGVALCALEGLIPESSNEGKVIAILERMSQSKGPAVTQLKTGCTRNSTLANLDFLKILSEYYPQQNTLQTAKSFVGFKAMAHPS